MLDVLALAQTCAPNVHPATMAAVIRVESGFNPFAIGVVGGRLERQPVSKEEAVATALALEKAGYNFSLGAAQVNRHNLARFSLDYAKAFDACENIRAGGGILKECYDRARPAYKDEQQALQAAFSCYYSGNFSTGFRPDFPGQPSYVQKVLASAGAATDGAGADVPKVQPLRVIRTAPAKPAQKGSAAAGGARDTDAKPPAADTGVISVGEDGKSSQSVMVYQ